MLDIKQPDHHPSPWPSTGLIPQLWVIFAAGPAVFGASSWGAKFRTYSLKREANPLKTPIMSCATKKTKSHAWKDLVYEKNKNTLTGVDPPKLNVFRFGETGTICLGRTKLSKCISGTEEQPFRIFYGGIPVEPRLLKHIIHCTLHATSMYCLCGAQGGFVWYKM